MKIVLIGYGKMGREIEQVAIKKGHSILLRIDKDDSSLFDTDTFKSADVAIEFSTPETAYNNISKCILSGVPVVSGTTGWLDKFDEIQTLCTQKESAFFYASNFSLGVNIFFELNRQLAEIMNNFNDYSVQINETHHIHKLDAPSGTAVSLANDLANILNYKSSWVCNKKAKNNEISIIAERTGNITGIHTIKYESSVDSIEIKHSAKNRQGFAIGALLAAEYIIGNTGVFNMNDLLNFKVDKK